VVVLPFVHLQRHIRRLASEPVRVALPSEERGGTMTTVTKLEQTQGEKANASGNRPVVFVHGLWLLPTSWIAGRRSSKARVRGTIPGVAGRSGHRGRGEGAPGGHSQEVDQGRGGPLRRGHPGLKKKPAVVGHSFGGLMTERSWLAEGCPRFRSRSLLHRSAVSCRCPSPHSGPDRRCCGIPAIATAPSPSRSSSSSIRSPTRSARARRSTCTTRSACRLRVSRCSRRRPPT
jgi:hypothetical protein